MQKQSGEPVEKQVPLEPTQMTQQEPPSFSAGGLLKTAFWALRILPFLVATIVAILVFAGKLQDLKINKTSISLLAIALFIIFFFTEACSFSGAYPILKIFCSPNIVAISSWIILLSGVLVKTTAIELEAQLEELKKEKTMLTGTQGGISTRTGKDLIEPFRSLMS